MFSSTCAVLSDTPKCSARYVLVFTPFSAGSSLRHSTSLSASTLKPWARSDGFMLRWPMLLECMMKLACSSEIAPIL